MPAYYCSSIKNFLSEPESSILGKLADGTSKEGFLDHKNKQTEVWKEQIEILRIAFLSLLKDHTFIENWGVLLEYPIPRRQKRIDVVILAKELIIAVEFKINYEKEAERQVEDYCLDLRDFHKQSKNKVIVPILMAIEGPAKRYEPEFLFEEIRPVVNANKENFSTILIDSYLFHKTFEPPQIDLDIWNNSVYEPVPTIIEAAEFLFAGHDVREISCSHADVFNLTKTTEKVLSIIKDAQENNKKAICFITGVPGAGKTLAGLNIVHNPEIRASDKPAGVFLSGNGPLVKIVSEALARDHHKRTGKTLKESLRVVKTFIQNVHAFFKEYLENQTGIAPCDNVVVFDEAQRAWNAEKEKRKFSRDISEPMMMLDVMDRHDGWAVIVALVGGGQEIHDGEAGLAEWGKAILLKHRHWDVYASPEALKGGESVAGNMLFEGEIPVEPSVEEETALHLNVSIRSFRAVRFTEWINAVLQGEIDRASSVINEIHKEFPIMVTRSLDTAKEWLKKKTKGYRRCGLVTSSGALRHRAYGIEVSSSFHGDYPFTEWFLAHDDDIRSSYQLEVAATEFECQGLELDWVGICWGNDFTWNSEINDWKYRQFKGTKWQTIRKEIDKRYLMNKYRVLLSRAREGIIIWIPEGNPDDGTLDPIHFDSTYQYLLDCGTTPFKIAEIKMEKKIPCA